MNREDEIRDLAQRGVEAVFDEDTEFDTDRANELATLLATWAFQSTADQAVDGVVSEDDQIQAITNAIAAAYFAGVIDSGITNPQGLTIPGKSGTIVNVYIS